MATIQTNIEIPPSLPNLMTVDTFFLDNYVVSSLLIIIFLLLKYEFLRIIMLTFI